MIELAVVVAILSIIIIGVGNFTRDIIVLNARSSNDVNTVYEVRALLKTAAKELRSASPSSLGAYPIDTAGTSTLVFYADTNGDGLKERIRYFLSGTVFKRGSVIPSGSPLSYNLANETMSILATGMQPATTTPLFQYFGSAYSGSEAPLATGDISSIRLVKINMRILPDAIRNPRPILGTIEVSLRNLKDNL